MPDRNPLDPPLPSVGDRVEVAMRAVVASVPVLGGAALELYNAVIRPPLERRNIEWMEEVASALRQHADRIETLETLSTNDLFVTAMLLAGRAAVVSTDPTKREALKNAVLNVATHPNLNEDEVHHYLGLVDQLSPLSVRLLAYLADPRAWAGARGVNFPAWNMGGISIGLEFAMPELRGNRETYDRLVRDLYSRGLIAVEGLHTTVTGPSILEGHATPFGNRFIQFITFE